MGMREDVCAPGGILREIGATAAEFERGLRLAVGTALSMPRSGLLRVDDPGTVLEVTLTEMPDRRIGLFRIPVLHAQLCFLSGSRAARQALLARIDLAMQRGGG